MEKLLTELTNRLTKTFSTRLVSVVLYGSAATGEHDQASDINTLCVLTDVTPRELKESEAIFRWWRDKGNPAPLLLSAHEVRTSTDCFPIEFHDMKERRRILAGEDVIEGLEIDDAFYRAQVEYQLRAKLVRLRQKAAGVLTDKDLLRKLMIDSISTFCVLFRHAARLGGHAAPWGRRAIIDEMMRRFEVDTAPLLQIVAMREGRIRLTDVEPEPLLEQYLKQLQVVIDHVDRLQK